jgi:hypothetical protein
MYVSLRRNMPPLCLLVVLVLVVESLRAIVLVGIVLVCTLVPDVVLVIHILRSLFGMTMGLNLVVFVHSFCLSKFIDLATYKASEKLLGELVRNGLACQLLGSKGYGRGEWRRHAFLALVVLIELETLEGGSTCDQLMRELGLVFVALVSLVVLLSVDLLMSVLGFVCSRKLPELPLDYQRDFQ